MEPIESVSDLLLQWEELRQQGRPPTVEELCQDHPELVDQVRRELQILEAVYRVPNGLTAAAGTVADSSPATLPEAGLPCVAGYEILGELGRGGMGVVYQARQTGLKRLVALKMLLARAHAGRQEVARFRVEAEAVARLQHANIVQIHEIGEQDGCPYLALEYVAGGSLAQRLQGTPFPPRAAAELVEQLAAAVDFAHRQGIVHRDLKPANVLLTADGVPKIADFGLAKRLDGPAESAARSYATASGSILGSPSYMAPEQAEGRTRDVGPAVDVYALGAILYELLTGRPPFRAATLLETLEQVRSEEPVAPRVLQSNLPADLETICLKCLHKDPGRRYLSARDLADDLGRFLRGELIRARHATVFDWVRHALDRSEHDSRFHTWSPLLLATSPVCFVVMTFASVGSSQGWLPADMLVVLPLTSMWAILGLLYWGGRWRALLPSGAAERQFWSLWLGEGVGAVLLTVVCWQMASGHPSYALAVYPPWAVLTGLTFFVMGGNFWGRCYFIGAAFALLAVLMPLRLEWAPIEYGFLMSLTMLVLSLRLRRLGQGERPQDPGRIGGRLLS